jgi:hypothetical protein
MGTDNTRNAQSYRSQSERRGLVLHPNHVPRLFHIYVMPCCRGKHSGGGFASIIPNVKGPRKAGPDCIAIGGPRESSSASSEGGIHGSDE